MLIFELDESWLDACIRLDEISMDGFWTVDQWKNELNDPNRLCLGIPKNSTSIKGVISGLVIQKDLHITAIAVDPSKRKQGIGSFLLSELIQRSQKLGANWATLEVSTGNTTAIAFYDFFGFKTHGYRKNYYKNGCDALIKWRSINSF